MFILLNGPNLVSLHLALVVSQNHILGPIGCYFRTVIVKDPVRCPFSLPAQFRTSLEAEDEALPSEYCYCDGVLPICDRGPFRFNSGTNRSYRELPFSAVR